MVAPLCPTWADAPPPPRRDGDDPIMRMLELQRELANDPANALARGQLRALLDELGVNKAAYDIPTGARLADRGWWHTAWPGFGRKAWISVYAGRDSNINSGTELSEIQVPLINSRKLTVNELLQERPSNFVLLQGGGWAELLLTPPWSVAVDGRAAWRYNTSVYEYFPHGYDGNLTATYQGDWARFRLGAGGEQRWLINRQLVSASTLKAEAGMPIQGDYALSIDARRSSLRYPQFQGIKTLDRALGAEIADQSSGSRVYVDVGDESSPSGPSDMDRRYASASLRLNVSVSEKGLAMAECRVTESRYKKPSPLFLTRREDRTTACLVGYEHSIGQNWFWGPSLVLERNVSSLALTDYFRRQVMLGARKEF